MRLTQIVIGLIALTAIACEDVIDIELKDSEPKLVIEGWINNAGFAEVRLSRTVPFDQPYAESSGKSTVYNPVLGAEVVISSASGPGRRLTEKDTKGLYTSSIEFFGLTENSYYSIDRTFHLSVKVEGEEYEATSVMPDQVSVDSVGTIVSDFLDEKRKSVGLLFTDPPGIKNYYRYVLSVNDKPVKTIFVYNDKFNDGKTITRDLLDFDNDIVTGDLADVEVQFIDSNVYKYWSSLQANNPGSAAPGNPVSNISNGALGYFSAHSVIQVQTIIQ